MFMDPRIRQIMPAAPGMLEVAVNRGHMQPFSADPDDDIHAWPIVGFALVEEMDWPRHDHDWTNDENELCSEKMCGEPTVVLRQVMSAMVMTHQCSDIELVINLFDVDDAKWRRVMTLQPGEEAEDWRGAARMVLDEEKVREESYSRTAPLATPLPPNL